MIIIGTHCSTLVQLIRVPRYINLDEKISPYLNEFILLPELVNYSGKKVLNGTNDHVEFVENSLLKI